MTLTDGFHAVPEGRIAAVVTHLEMTEPVAPRAVPDPDGVSLEHIQSVDLERYRAVFTAVGGQDWLWFSRLRMSDNELAAIVHDPHVELYFLRCDGKDAGILELDFRDGETCELGFFALSSELIGGGVGRWLMNQAIAKAWSKPIRCFHLHTCTFDSQGALAFYQRSGFKAVRQEVQIVSDPRLDGLLPLEAAAHVPLIRV